MRTLTPQLGRLLDSTGEALDISEKNRNDAVRRYTHLGYWLCEKTQGRASVDIYPQGSFRLGTVIRPIDDTADFDIDLVFRRDLRRSSITQEDLREQAGELLKDYCQVHGLAEPIPLGRCWRLELFDEGFHLDVLPVIPDDTLEPHGILLSDKDRREWLHSNPIGYADWFYGRMNQEDLRQRRAVFAKSAQMSVADVPIFALRTPLQRAVQLLKRGRDEYFVGRPEIAPPSILVTTLAAFAYEGQTDVADALEHVVRHLADAVQYVDGEWVVENPAHVGENFADKWNQFPERRDVFFEWRDATVEALDLAARSTSIELAGSRLAQAFGVRAEEAANKLSSARPTTLRMAASRTGRAPREQVVEEQFPVRLTGKVEVTFEVADPTTMNRYERRAATRERRLGKGRRLRFRVVSTTVAEPFDVFWKVRNFGRKAMQADGLRGRIVPDSGGRELDEHTKYKGEHYVDCYVVKDGVCVARERTWVPIR